MDKKYSLRFFRNIYGLLLYLYPRAFLEEFREELEVVFDLSLQEAMRNGGNGVAAIAIRELLGLPRAILYEHLRQRRRSNMVL
jgi:hypothetical protein